MDFLIEEKQIEKDESIIKKIWHIIHLLFVVPYKRIEEAVVKNE